MARYFPYNLQPLRVEERREFYETEFSTEQAMNWLQIEKNNFADVYIDVGSETTRYRPMFSDYLNKLVHVTYSGEEMLQRKLIKYRPEDVYYQRTYRSRPQSQNNQQGTDKREELAFDLDPKGAAGGCPKCKTRASKLNGNKRLKAILFCRDCFEEVTEHCLNLHKFLTRHFHQVKAVFSGRGYHLHVRDREGLQLEQEDRQELANKLVEEFPIDPEVTAGSKNLIRLPGSLNGVVGKKVVFVSQKELEDPEAIIRKSQPRSLQR